MKSSATFSSASSSIHRATSSDLFTRPSAQLLLLCLMISVVVLWLGVTRGRMANVQRNVPPGSGHTRVAVGTVATNSFNLSINSVATSVVTNTNDNGVGSLRESIRTASSGGEIRFASPLFDTPQVITLTSAELVIDKNLTITGPGAELLTISGNNTSRVFFINPGGAGAVNPPAAPFPLVHLSHLRIVNGKAQAGNGGKGLQRAGGGGGGAGMGGAIFINGATVTIDHVDFDHNQALGGNGGQTVDFSGFAGGGGGGGTAANGSDTGAGTGNVLIGGNGGGGGSFGGNGGSGGPEYGSGVNGGEGSGGGGNGGNFSGSFGGNQSFAPGNGGFGGGGAGGAKRRIPDGASAGGGGGFGGGGGGGINGLAPGGGGSFGGAGGGGGPQGGSGGGGAGLGGAVFLRAGNLILQNSTFSSNSTTGGNGGAPCCAPAGSRGQGKGGGIFIHTSATASATSITFDNNTAQDAANTPTDNHDIYGLLRQPPVASDQSVTDTEDLVTLITLGASDPNVNDQLTYTITSGPAHGALTGSGNSYSYTPNLNYNGPDSFTFTASDGAFESNTATVSITVEAVNDAPTITANSVLSVTAGASGTIDSTRLLVSDPDNTAPQLVFTVGAAPTHGVVKNNGVPLFGGGTFTQDDIDNNRVTFTHNGNAASTDSFTFTVSDSAGGAIGTTTFNLSINCVATSVVTNTNDGGAGSLREAIITACPGNSITFNVPTSDANYDSTKNAYTIQLSSELVLDRDLSIPGPTTARLIISGQNVSRVFSVTAGSAVSIANLTIANGRQDFGGGIYNLGNLIISNSTVIGNQAVGGSGEGGAIDSEAGTLTIINSTISGNAAETNGGGLHNSGTSTAVLTNVTIANNQANANGSDGVNTLTGAGGGIAQVSSNSITLNNTIVAGNFNDATPTTMADDIFVRPGSGALSAASSLIGDAGTAGGISNGTNGNQVGNAGSGTISINTVLNSTLANNGGPTATHLLVPGSPAINAGDNLLAKDENTNPLTTDQRGSAFARTVEIVDIGAFEVQAGVPDRLIFGVQPSDSIVGTAIAPSVTVQILDAGNHPTTSTTNITISLGTNPGGTVGGTTTVAAVNGLATFTNLSINNSGSGYTLVAGSTDLTGATSNPFNIQRASQSITVSTPAPSNAIYNTNFTVAATSSSALAVAYSSSGACTNIGPVFTMTSGTGVCTVKYDQGGDSNHNAAVQLAESVMAQKSNQSITVSTPAPSSTMYNTSFTVAATSSSGQTVAYSSSGACTNIGPVFTMTSGTGVCTVKYDQAGDSNHSAAVQLAESVMAQKSNQSITVSTPAPSSAIYNTSFTVAASSNSGQTVAYSSSGACTNIGPVFTMTSGTGVCTVKYDQAGDSNHNAANQVTQSVTAQKSNQAITVSTPAPSSSIFNTSFTVAATSSSSLAVAYSSSGACTNIGPVFTMTSGTGVCTVKYDQAGDSNHIAAVQVTESVMAQKSNQSITVSTPAPSSSIYNTSFTVAATSSSGLAVAYSSSGTCMNIGPVFTMTSGTGVCTVKYDQAGDSNHNAANQVTELVTAEQATTTTTLSSSLNPSALGQSVTFTATVTSTAGMPTGAIQFKIDGANSDLPVNLTGSGAAQLTTSSLTAGTHVVTADYSGDGNFASSTGTVAEAIDNRSLVSLSQANFDVNESRGFVTITVNRTGDFSLPVTVDYLTDDTGSPNACDTSNALASDRCDFGLTLGTLRFAVNETQKSFVIPITQDSYAEGAETFTVNLSNLTGSGAVFTTPSSATVTISDGTDLLSGNAIDDTEVFVRQQYRDFLNRDADLAGLAFWKNNIDRCKTPGGAAGFASVAQCLELMRINTSAAFFLSIEFQSTGNLVRSFYVAALNRLATNNTLAFTEFERDSQSMQRDVIVGQGNWQQTLEDNRNAFMKDFVMRPEFVGLYPTTDLPNIYVGKLYRHAMDRNPTAGELEDGVNEFPTGATQATDPAGRGRALLRLIQGKDFQHRELSRAFVQIEYFGYLRRNPNDVPDTDFSGYDFWLDKLNAAGGNFIEAEMVKAFIVSREYRSRFGP